MVTRVATIKTNNQDPINNIPVNVANTRLVREIHTQGDLVGVLKSEPVLGEDGLYWATLGLNVEVGAVVSGTCALGAKVYVNTTNDITLTAGTNRQIGIATRAKAATGDRLWFVILPTLGLAAAA